MSSLDYNIRATTPEDKELCAAWIAGDPEHQGKTTPEFFVEAEPGVEKFVWENRQGEPILYFRLSRALRVDIQFGPSATAAERDRTIEALQAGMGWLRSAAEASGHRQIIFESRHKPLVRFCSRRLGFQKSPDELVCGIAAPKADKAQEQPLHHQQEQP